MTANELAKATCNRLGLGGHEFSIYASEPKCACGAKDLRTMPVSEIGRRPS